MPLHQEIECLNNEPSLFFVKTFSVGSRTLNLATVIKIADSEIHL